MPNLAFSPVPHGREKENTSSPSATPRGSTGNQSKNVDPTTGTTTTSTVTSTPGRSPLEIISAVEGDGGGGAAGAHLASPAAAAAAAMVSAGPVVCKRSSSCTCPDCAAAASVFGIDQLRQVGVTAAMSASDEGVDVAGSVPATRTPSAGQVVARTPLPGETTTSPARMADAARNEARHENADDDSSVDRNFAVAISSSPISPLAVSAEDETVEHHEPGTVEHTKELGGEHETCPLSSAGEDAGFVTGAEGENAGAARVESTSAAPVAQVPNGTSYGGGASSVVTGTGELRYPFCNSVERTIREFSFTPSEVNLVLV